ncbi:MAG: hypothetical protein J6B95_02560 [Oscillospiraceae bacterium]|nr:hypothetical protein [Oscillospiraceae bacterium]
MAQHEFAMMDTEHLLWLLTWDSMMAEGDGLSVDDVELICRIITARKKALFFALQDDNLL